MAQYFARVVRAVIVSTLGFGGGVGLLVLIIMLGLHHAKAVQFAWQAGLIIGLLFAFVLVGVMLPLDLTAHLFLAKGVYKEVWELEQIREVIAEGTIKEIMHATRQALLMVPYVTNVSDDAEHSVTTAQVGASWRSPGERIEVKIEPLSETSWKLRCTSHSPSTNVVFDYGKNFENVEVWQKSLQSLLHTTSSPS